jgi:hypothetical protein
MEDQAMKWKFAPVLLLILTSMGVSAQKPADIPNPSIDMKGYLRVAAEASKHREKRRLTEDDFIRMSKQTGVIVLDARSKQKYDELHIKDAINLSFPDITVESLATTLPDKKRDHSYLLQQ